MTTKNQLLKVLGIIFFVFSVGASASIVGAQYYNPYNDPNYNYYNNNYSQPYGVTSFNGGGYEQNYAYNYNNYNYNNNYDYGNYNYNNYNNGYYNNIPNVSVSSVDYLSYNYPYNNYNNYNNNYDNNYYTGNYNYNGYNYSNYYSGIYPSTAAATNVTPSSGTINGYVTTSGNNYYNNGYYYNSVGTAYFEYGTNPDYFSQHSNPANIYQSTTINSHLTGLSCGRTYYYRAVTNSQNGTQYGNVLSFTTLPCNYGYGYNSGYDYNYDNYNYYDSGYSYGYLPDNVATHCKYGKKRYY